MKDLTKLLILDMKPSLGVTEPGAIALAVAVARDHTSGLLEAIRLELNSGIYKNAYTCGIPNTHEVGCLWAAALGYVAGEAEKGLQALDNIDSSAIAAAQSLISRGAVTAEMTGIDSEIFIRVSVQTQTSCCRVTIQHAHTNITSILVNGRELLTQPQKAVSEPDAAPQIHSVSFREILQYARTVPLEEIEFLRDAFQMNLALLEKGLQDDRTVIAQYLLQKNRNLLISEDVLCSAQLLCAGAIEARVLGIGAPAMSITGSGSHGIIAVMPLYAAAKSAGLCDEKLLRASALSMLLTQYIKEYSGKLSAMCGCGVAAGTGMACALTELSGGDEAQIGATLRNMALSITGMICDGGNHGCALKAIAATDAAFRASSLALAGICLSFQHGIAGKTPEETMRYIGYVSSNGMKQTECTIVEIMQSKASAAKSAKEAAQE